MDHNDASAADGSMDRTPEPISRRSMLQRSGATLAALGVAGAMGAASAGTAAAAAQQGAKQGGTPKPVIVLCHGAWADGSSWSGVIERLQDADYTVIAPAVGLGSVAADIASVRKVVASLGAPALLVGHSYGGFVITGAASGLANVTGLVYVAAYAPDQGESVFALNTQFDAQFGPSELGHAIRPDGPLEDPATLLFLDRGEFRAVFAQDVSRDQAAIMAAVQRPPQAAGFVEALAVAPAWRQVPTWYQVSSADRVIQPGGQRFMAQRMGATTLELPASHCSLVSEPKAIAQLIVRAARTVR